MDILEEQDKIFDIYWNNAVEKITTDICIDEHFKDPENDNRRCVSLIVRLPQQLKEIILKKIEELKAKFPKQFFYPPENFHFTVIALIELKEDLVVGEELTKDINRIVEKAIRKHNKFEIEFRGINISPISLFIKGYADDTLAKIRKDIISEIAGNNLGLDIDFISTYDKPIAWSTIMRFTDCDVSELIEEIEKLREYEFGKFKVKEIELVITDKFLSQKATKVLSRFSLE